MVKPQPSPSPVEVDEAQDAPISSDANGVPDGDGQKVSPLGKTAKHLKGRGLAHWYLPPDSKVRVIALNILALRAAGKSDEEIATELNLSVKSISPYVYRAAKNGWIQMDRPLDRVKYELLNRVVERLDEGLEDGRRHNSSGMRVRTQVALKMAEGTIFKEFDQAATAPTQSTVVAVQVIMPPGVQQVMREDTAGGRPNFIEAETV
jgi:transposase